MTLNKYFYSILYVVVCALGAVVMENLVTEITPTLALLYVTIIAIIYFHCLNYRKMLTIYRTLFLNYKKEFLLINLLAGLMWLCTYCGNYYSSASMMNYLFFTTLGISSQAKSLIPIKKNMFRIILSLILLFSPLAFYRQQFLGITLSILGGLIAYFYNLITYQLSKKINISATQTLAIRLWLLLIIMFIYNANHISCAILTLSVIEKIMLLAFLTFILQIFLAQKGLYAIGVTQHGVILSLTPLATLLLQGLILHQWYEGLLILTCCSPLICNDLLWGKPRRLI